MDFRLGELFSGPGGLAIGAQRASTAAAKISHQWASDHDADACRTWASNVLADAEAVTASQPHPEDAPMAYQSDIRSMDLAELPAIDALAFGAPCNDHSRIGERRGLAGAYGPLYSYGVEVLVSHRPAWFLFENVGGIRGEALRTVMADFEAAGYRLTPHYYDFSDYGVAQKRKRVIVIGVRDDLDVEYRVPAPITVDVTTLAALSGIADDAPNHEQARTAATTVERLRHIRPGQNAWTADLPEHLRINTNTTISSMYRRLDPEQPSYTVTGSGGGGYHIYHFDEPRPLTNRERARLQSFDDDFVFCGSRSSVRRQIGMAVPPRGAETIFAAVLNSFAGVDYPWVEPNMSSIIPANAHPSR